MPLSNVRNHEILESLSHGLMSIDRDFKVTFFNRTAEQITGRSREEVLGKECGTVCKSEFCRNECPIIKVLASGKSIHDYESKIQCGNESVIPVKLNAAVLKKNNGEITGTLISFRDISELYKNKTELQGSTHFHGVIGKSTGMKDIFELIKEISRSNASVLIEGETGTGKEMIANAIHTTSPRYQNTYVKVNCSVIPPHLLASELFGHKKGAFTDAVQDRMGRFELADNGTLFLDEISEMTLQMQAQLLRILQEGTFERLGESITKKVNVRIIAATNTQIREAIKKGNFREDLFYRLNVIPIEVPPLRERKEDIVYLVDHFIQKFSVLYKKSITEIDDDALELLTRYNWPGNVRELENVMEYAFARTIRNISICACSLPPYLRQQVFCEKNNTTKPNSKAALNGDLIHLLVNHNWNKSEVAKILGVNRSTVWRRLKALGINQ